MQAKPDFGKNVRGGGGIFMGGVTMIYSSQRRVEIKIPYFYIFFIIISACLVIRNIIKQ